MRGETQGAQGIQPKRQCGTYRLILTTDQLVVIASAPSEPPLISGDNQRRMEETNVRTDDRTEVGMVACCAARPWMFGPRLGHIRVRNDEIQCKLVRYAPSEEHPRSQCQQGFPPESLHLQAAAETSELSSQGGSAGSNPVGATSQNPLQRNGFCASKDTRLVELGSRTVAAIASLHSTDNTKIGRNERCPCGSGLRYKRCHGLAGRRA